MTQSVFEWHGLWEDLDVYQYSYFPPCGKYPHKCNMLRFLIRQEIFFDYIVYIFLSAFLHWKWPYSYDLDVGLAVGMFQIVLLLTAPVLKYSIIRMKDILTSWFILITNAWMRKPKRRALWMQKVSQYSELGHLKPD